jgi:hypothetical protein
VEILRIVPGYGRSSGPKKRKKETVTNTVTMLLGFFIFSPESCYLGPLLPRITQTL